MTDIKPIGSRKLLFLTCIISFLLLLSSLFYYWHLNRAQSIRIKDIANKTITKAALELNNDFANAKKVATQIARQISSGKLQKANFNTHLKNLLSKNHAIEALGIVYFPYITSPNPRVHTPYYITQQGTQVLSSDKYIQIVSVPFYHYNKAAKKRLITGIVIVDYSKIRLRSILNRPPKNYVGYSFLLNQQGQFVVHPVTEYIKSKKTLYNLAVSENNKPLLSLAKKIFAGKSGYIDYYDPYSATSSLIHYQQIPSNGWSLSTVVVWTHSIQFKKNLYYSRCLIILTALIFLLLLISYVVFPTLENQQRCWVWTSAISLTLIAAIISIWFLSLDHRHSSNNKNGVAILNNALLEEFIADNNIALSRLGYPKPLYVPTGIHIESINFTEFHQLRLAGYIWQKYKTRDLLDGVKPGIYFKNSYKEDIKLIYRKSKNNFTRLGWRFNATVVQHFSREKYPFDARTIALQIQPKDHNKNIIIIPDLATYPSMAPQAHPGIKASKNLDWQIKSSVFAYTGRLDKLFDPKIGIMNYIGHYPQLGFHILISRHFFYPLLANLIPIILLNFILFVILVTAYEVKFTTFLTGCSGIMLGAIIAYMNYRRLLKTSDILYLDWFYFMIYLGILLIVIEGYLFRFYKRFTILQRNKNLLFRVLYIPLCLLGVLCFTTFILIF